MYDAGLSPSKTALDVNVRSLLGLTEFEYDDMGPGRINVRIPPVNETGLATQWKDPGLEKNGAAGRSAWEHAVGGEAVMLRNKRPQYDEKRGGHVLDFHGRVSMPSVKNFQLQSDVRLALDQMHGCWTDPIRITDVDARRRSDAAVWACDMPADEPAGAVQVPQEHVQHGRPGTYVLHGRLVS